MTIPTPFSEYRETVDPGACDYNGHMNVGYYLLAFENAARAFFRYVGLSQAYRERTNHALFVSETHLTFEREVRAGDPLRFATQLLGATAKAIDVMHFMYHADSGQLSATNEVMYLHVDLEGRRIVPFPAEARAHLRRIEAAHAHLPRPPQAGRRIALRRR
ncbi:MAG TPA: thioesterase family protein [Kiloniellales bacterium]